MPPDVVKRPARGCLWGGLLVLLFGFLILLAFVGELAKLFRF
jgi:hypothetical protein